MFAALVCALAVTSCKPAKIAPIDTLDPPVDAGPAVSDVVDPSSYCHEIVDFFCPYYVRCGRIVSNNVDACRPLFLEMCQSRFQKEFEALAGANLITLSRRGIDACHAHLDDVRCEDQLQDLDGACSAMWVGKQPQGSPCGFDVESLVCAPSTSCKLDLSFCGTCTTTVAAGEACDGNVACAAGSSCDGTTCAPLKAVGATCADGERCVLGAFCQNNVCAGPAYMQVGQTCDQLHRCPFGSACQQGSCRLSAGLDQSCSGGVACHSGTCTDGTCKGLLDAGEGCDGGAQCVSGICQQNQCAPIPGHCFQ
jgi:hypothetical protein